VYFATLKRFSWQAIVKRRVSQKVTLDGYVASYQVVANLPEEGGLPATLSVLINHHAARAADPSVPAEPSALVGVAGR